MDIVLVGVMGYVVLQLLIGAYVSRRIQTEDDYLVAGRSLGYGLSTFTIFATWFGAETCIGAAGSIYENGLAGGTSDPFGYGVCLLLMGLVFAAPLWRGKFTTLGDLFRVRYSPRVERVAVLLLVPTSVMWAAAQIRAFGQVLAASSDFEVWITITVAAAVVILYTTFGGLLADAWTDLVQGIMLIVGLIVVFVAILMSTGTEALTAIPPERLQLAPMDGASVWALMEEWAIPIVGSTVAAELVARIVATRTPEIARRSSLMAAGIYIIIGLIPVSIGLMGFHLLPGLEHPEQILPLIARQHLPTVLYMLFVGALVSAILSTVDSALLVAAALVSHNLIVPLRSDMPEAQKVRIARTGVVVFGVAAYVMALYAEGVYALVEEASAFGSAGIFTVIVFGLFTRLGRSYSALASLGSGIFVWVLGAYLLAFPYPYLTSLAAALVAYLGTALFEGRREEAFVMQTKGV